MSFEIIKPRRTFRQELIMLLLVAFVTSIPLLFFPFDAIHFKPKPHSRGSATFMIIDLADQRYAEAVANIKSGLSRTMSQYNYERLDLSEDVPPETTDRPLVDVNERARPQGRDHWAHKQILPRLIIGGEPMISAPQMPVAEPICLEFSREQLLDSNILPYKIQKENFYDR